MPFLAQLVIICRARVILLRVILFRVSMVACKMLFFVCIQRVVLSTIFLRVLSVVVDDLPANLSHHPGWECVCGYGICI